MLIPALSESADATQFSLTSDTILQSYQRDLPNASEQQALPIYQYLQLDYGKTRPTGLSFHSYGWMRLDLGDEYLEDDFEGELLYAYLQYDSPSTAWMARAGRFYVFEGVANEAVDGVSGRIRLPYRLTLSAYAGQPVALAETRGRSGDHLLGGRIAHHRTSRYELGVSYKTLANDGSNNEQFAGFDGFVALPRRISLQGTSVYNLNTEGWAEHFYELRLPLRILELRPYYQRYNFDDFFTDEDSSAFPFRFLAGTGNTLEVLGAEIYIYFDERYELAGRIRHYEYGKRFDSADYFTVMLTRKFKILSQLGLEAGRMEGSEAEQRFSLGRAFFYWDRRPWFLSGDAMLVNYDREIFGKDNAWFASLGCGRGFAGERFKLKFSVDYSDDPYLDKNFRATLAAHYRYGH